MRAIILFALAVSVTNAYRLTTFGDYNYNLRNDGMVTDHVVTNMCKVLVDGVLVHGDCDTLIGKFGVHMLVDKTFDIVDTLGDVLYKDKMHFLCVDKFCDRILIGDKIFNLHDLFHYCVDKRCVIDLIRGKLTYYIPRIVTDVLMKDHLIRDGVVNHMWNRDLMNRNILDYGRRDMDLIRGNWNGDWNMKYHNLVGRRDGIYNTGIYDNLMMNTRMPWTRYGIRDTIY